MALDDSYIKYPNRKEGYDHDIYDWSAIKDRKPISWPDQKSVAVWICVSLEWFPIVAEDTPFKAPGHMQTAYPDYRHYTAREYGTRVGVYRLLDAFKNSGVKVSFATNAAIAQRYPELVRDIIDAGHEIIAHSTDMNGTIASGMDKEEEAQIINSTLNIWEEAIGERPQGWLSIARSQSFNTPDVLKEAGVKYCCDWVNDELPYRFNNGLINLPLNHELSDRQIITVQQQSIDSYGVSMIDAFNWLAKEAQQYGGRMLPMHITPYIMALPYRIDGFEKMLDQLASRNEAWFATGADIISAWESNS